MESTPLKLRPSARKAKKIEDVGAEEASSSRRMLRPSTRPVTTKPQPEETPRSEAVVRRHKKTENGGHDPFFIPKEMIPKGYSIEWKRITTVNKEEDDSYFADLDEQGWRPATVKQFPKLVSPGFPGKSIIRKGMMLMIRPKELTEEARQEDLQIAREQVRDKIKSLGQTEKGELKRKVQSLKRTYERPPVEDEEGPQEE